MNTYVYGHLGIPHGAVGQGGSAGFSENFKVLSAVILQACKKRLTGPRREGTPFGRISCAVSWHMVPSGTVGK